MEDEEFLQTLKEYVECMEVKIDSEWGTGKSVTELVDDMEMPDIYHEIVRRLEEL